MFINPRITDELYNDAGFARCERAKQYVKEKRVNIKKTYYEDMNNFSIEAKVFGNYDEYEVYISTKNGEIDNVSCQCPDYYKHYGTCKHVVSVIQEVDGNPKYVENITKKTNEKYTEFKELINTFYGNEIDFIEEVQKQELKLDTNIKIVPKIIYDKFTKELKMEFKVGLKQLYKIKDLTEFYDNMIQKQIYKYGAKFQFMHEEDSFCEESKPILEFMLKHAEIIKYVNTNSNNGYRYYGRLLNTQSITLTNSSLDEIFEILKNKKVLIEKDYLTQEVEFIEDNPKIEFN